MNSKKNIVSYWGVRPPNVAYGDLGLGKNSPAQKVDPTDCAIMTVFRLAYSGRNIKDFVDM